MSETTALQGSFLRGDFLVLADGMRRGLFTMPEPAKGEAFLAQASQAGS